MLSNTDKGCYEHKRQVGHCYLHFYEPFVRHLRDARPRILEVGIFQGASILMWSQYFQCARIYAWDIMQDPTRHPKFMQSGAKFRCVCCMRACVRADVNAKNIERALTPLV